jgi:HNH endonuclease
MEKIKEIGWDVTTSGCHEWRGARNDLGYALLNHHRVSRIVYQDTHGTLPKVVRHTCDNPPCIRRDHLLGGTQTQNMRDMDERGRRKAGWAGQDQCKKGHDLTIPGAVKTAKHNGRTERLCVECDRARKREYMQRKRAA